ncbi:MAG: RsfS/YbeB/iojap family protein [Acholeplasmatales bacterium]|nr:RsfS/YbeB/iojap family protein [Acholeplasmatales bacterium]
MNKLEAIIKGLKRVNPSDMVCYDSNLVNPFFEFIFVATVDSVRQANVSIEYIKESLEEAGLGIKSYEGFNSGWILIDGYDFLVHVFTEEERQRVNVDKIYMNLEKIDLTKYIEE